MNCSWQTIHSFLPSRLHRAFHKDSVQQIVFLGVWGEEKKNLLIASYLLFVKVRLVTGPTPLHFILCVLDHMPQPQDGD